MELWRKSFLGRCLFLKLLVLKLQNFKNLLHLLDSTIIIKRLLLPQSRFVRAWTLATLEVSTSICQNKCRPSSLTYVGSSPTLTLFIHNSRHLLSHLLSSIYSTFIHTIPGLHLHHTYMKCLDSLYFSCITCFSVGCIFQIIVTNSYLSSSRFIYHAFLPSHPFVSFFSFVSIPIWPLWVQNPHPVCCQRGWWGGRGAMVTEQ